MFKNSGNVFHFSTGSSAPTKQLMIPMTSAIDHVEPSPQDLQRTAELQQVLESHNIFEPQNELNHRINILKKLTTLLQEWIKTTAVAKGFTSSSAAKLGGKIMPFGSYQLGVHQTGADIDALCVAPRCIERADFFSTFFSLVKEQREVTECRAIEGAFVPVIKLNYDGIEMDLLFARLLLKEIPDNLELSNDNLLRDLDERCVRSLNGCRVTDAILTLVPHHDNFRQSLRAIKLWAKKSGIYSNALGYFGGVTWAMLVARICQCYPNATAATIVEKFFKIFSKWRWPLPMLLTRSENVANLPYPVWNPNLNLSDRNHLMPIITPAYPQQNSTFNVTKSSRNIIVDEIHRGLETTKAIMEKRATWSRLFESPSFFNKYRHFVVLLVNSEVAEDHLEWCGLVEAKTRILIGNLERTPHVSMAHINSKCFELKKDNYTGSPTYSSSSSSSCDFSPSTNSDKNSPAYSTAFSSMWFIGLEFERVEKLNVDITAAIHSFVEHVTSFAVKIEMLREGMSVDARYVKRKQLRQYLDADVLERDRKAMPKLSTLMKQKKPQEEPASKSDEAHRNKRSADDISCPAKQRRVEFKTA